MGEYLVGDVRDEIDRQMPHLAETLPAGWQAMRGAHDRHGVYRRGLVSPDGLAWEVGADTSTMDELTRERDDVHVYLAVYRDGDDVRTAVGAALRGIAPAMAAGRPPIGSRLAIPARR